MEQMRKKICRLRCVLCREGLLQTYNVYDVPVDESPSRWRLQETC